MISKAWFIAKTATSCIAASAFLSASVHAQSRAEISEGRSLFVSKNCYQCHGYEGQGSGRTGPQIANTLLPDVAFVAYVRTPTRNMPAYSEKQLSSGELDLILAFLKSRPKSKPPEDIPLLAPYLTAAN